MFKAIRNQIGESTGWNAAVNTGQPGNRLFDYIDRQDGQKNGFLLWKDFVPFLARVGWSIHDAQAAWNMADKDRSGYLSRSEFLRFCDFKQTRMYIQQIEATLTGATGSGIAGINLSANTVQAATGGMQIRPPSMGHAPAVAVVQPVYQAAVPMGQPVAMGQPVVYQQQTYVQQQHYVQQPYAPMQPYGAVPPPVMQPMMQPYAQPMQPYTGAYGEATGMNAMMNQGQVGNRLFDYIDSRNGARNGTLAWTEFVPFLAQMGWSFHEAQMAWNTADIDRSGFLSRSEFIRFCNFPHVRNYIQVVESSLTGATGTGVPGVSMTMGAPMMMPTMGYGSPYY